LDIARKNHHRGVRFALRDPSLEAEEPQRETDEGQSETPEEAKLRKCRSTEKKSRTFYVKSRGMPLTEFPESISITMTPGTDNPIFELGDHSSSKPIGWDPGFKWDPAFIFVKEKMCYDPDDLPYHGICVHEVTGTAAQLCGLQPGDWLVLAANQEVVFLKNEQINELLLVRRPVTLCFRRLVNNPGPEYGFHGLFDSELEQEDEEEVRAWAVEEDDLGLQDTTGGSGSASAANRDEGEVTQGQGFRSSPSKTSSTSSSTKKMPKPKLERKGKADEGDSFADEAGKTKRKRQAADAEPGKMLKGPKAKAIPKAKAKAANPPAKAKAKAKDIEAEAKRKGDTAAQSEKDNDTGVARDSTTARSDDHEETRK
jgi:hypothetical protein